MLDNLKLSHKVGLLPAVSALGAVFIIATITILGTRTSGQLEEIEEGLYPSVELSRDLEALMTRTQRTLQDAVAAGDAEQLKDADVLAAEIDGQIDSAIESPWANQESLASLAMARPPEGIF